MKEEIELILNTDALSIDQKTEIIIELIRSKQSYEPIPYYPPYPYVEPVYPTQPQIWYRDTTGDIG